jgi:3'-phosphoadenosine 5'-phosphosulfate sulfotransferase (PAPS reductase)/FAD synthetase
VALDPGQGRAERLGTTGLAGEGPVSLASDALAVIDAGVVEHYPGKLFALFSGGDDSLTMTTIAAMHPKFSGCIHLDTRTGVPATRRFVVETCAEQGWPLEIYEAPTGEYERLVLDGYRTRDGRLHQGFPNGLKSHSTMYYYLKQRQIQAAIKRHKTSRFERIGLVTGIRTAESARRERTVMGQRALVYKDPERSAVWFNPIRNWTKRECLDFLGEQGMRRNPVSINCHRSGECLCGALANYAELEEIAFFYPEIGERYATLQSEAQARGLEHWQWAGGPTGPRRRSARRFSLAHPLCTSCQLTLWGDE